MRISDWSSDVCSSDLALTLYRRAIEHEKPDAQREAGYQDRDDARIEGAMQQMERRYVPEMDRQLQRYWLQQYVALPEEQHDEALDRWLGGSDDKHVERSEEHTSELQSLMSNSYAVFRLKKKNTLEVLGTS